MAKLKRINASGRDNDFSTVEKIDSGYSNLSDSASKLNRTLNTAAKTVDQFTKGLTGFTKEQLTLSKDLKDISNVLDFIDEANAQRKAVTDLYDKIYKLSTGNKQERAQAEQLRQDLNLSKEDWKQIIKEATDNPEAKQRDRDLFTSNLQKMLNSVVAKINASVDDAATTYENYQGTVNARLSGTTKTFKDLMDSNAKASPFYTTKEYASKLNDLITKGIASNVEQRAFLATISDKIADTFDVANSSMLRLIRLQSSDSTAARLGMEASLTEYLNQMYLNTEYLSDAFDSVTSSLVEAQSLMTSQSSTEFEYVVQKWLGSLYSAGLSEASVNSIAQAIGYLGSGNVNQLVGSSSGNLIAIAASNAGLDYAKMLKEGLDTSTTDTLMASIVQYMQQIANSSNNVVMSQLADVFGVTVSDLMASTNVDTSSIVGNNLTYGSALDKLAQRFSTDFSTSSIMAGTGALSVSEYLNNMVDNALFSLGAGVVDNAGQYLTYKVADVVAGLTSGMTTSVGKIANTVANVFKGGVLVSSGLENLYDLKNGAKLGFNITDIYNSLGSHALGSASTGSGYSISGTLNSNGTITSTSGSTKSTTEIKQEVTEDTEREKQINEAPLNIKEYLTNTFDKKMDSMVRMTASLANYSILSNGGTITGNFAGMLGEDTVAIVAPDSSNSEISKSISENVANIYTLLYGITTGANVLRVQLDQSSSNNLVGMMTSAVATGNTQVLTKYIGG